MAEDTRVQPFTYDAFISYRHVERDRKWAAWLIEALERYQVPKALQDMGSPPRPRRARFLPPYARGRARARAVSRGRAYRQPVRAPRREAVGIDATRRLLPLSERLPAGTLPMP